MTPPTSTIGDDLFFPNLSLPDLNLDFEFLISSIANSFNFSCLTIIALHSFHFQPFQITYYLCFLFISILFIIMGN